MNIYKFVRFVFAVGTLSPVILASGTMVSEAAKKVALALMLVCLLAPASSHAQSAYVANYFGNTVSVIDTATNMVAATIAVGRGPRGAAVSPDGSKAYVTNQFSNTLSVIDTATNTVSATIPVGLNPYGVAVGPDGKVYITSAGVVQVVDTVKNHVALTIPVDVSGGLPGDILVVSPDGSKVYVIIIDTGNVAVIDTATSTVTATIPMGLGIGPGMAVSPDGSKLYITSGEGLVSVIDTATNTVSAPVFFTVDGDPTAVVVSPDGSKLYVDGAVLDAATYTVIATTPSTTTNSGTEMAVSPDGSKLYTLIIVAPTTDAVEVLDTATNTVTATIPLGILSGTNSVAIAIQPPPSMQPPPTFAGVPGSKSCQQTSISVLKTNFGSLDAAAAALGFSTALGLKNAIQTFCL